jgi:hypothetical protein
MGSCCGKREQVTSKDGITNIGGITSSEVPKMIEYATKYI